MRLFSKNICLPSISTADKRLSGKVFDPGPCVFKKRIMEDKTLPDNGSQVRFMRKDDDEWRDGEYDAENKMFIEIYSTELTTHNWTDISQWELLET